ncbi:hypothetical protein CNEO2_440064 [Clostridium neonatale]|nr:hypothetical protein CNEO2_250063 [Clostridium neonatale]CAI3208916.1 hypothetical protein CNEO2_440064 [Clostridium neonatale]CAI3688886.1 hypothetical protein CNEO2_460064 [Clostridium neonatale]
MYISTMAPISTGKTSKNHINKSFGLITDHINMLSNIANNIK